MGALVTLEREKKITITRTRQCIPLSEESPDRRAVLRRCGRYKTIIFLRRRFRIREKVTGIVNQAIILFRGRIRIRKIMTTGIQVIDSSNQRIVVD
jgi:hypothetical protein